MTSGGVGAAFVAHTSKGWTGMMLALSLAMVLIGLAFWLSGELSFILFGSFVALFFGAAAVLLVRLLRDPRPVIEVDAGGILWRRWSDTPIPWSAVQRIATRQVQGRRYLCLWLHDPAAHRPRRRIVRLGGLNRRLGYGDIAIGTDGTDREAEELAAAIAQWCEVEDR